MQLDRCGPEHLQLVCKAGEGPDQTASVLLALAVGLFVGFFLGACAATWTLFVLLCAVAILCVLLLWRLAGSPYFTCTMQVEIDREAFDAKERNPARVSTWQPAREVFRSDSGRLYL